MSKADAALRHDQFKRTVDRAGKLAQTEFERIQIALLDELGSWMHEVHNDACNGITFANETKADLEMHKRTEKARQRGMKMTITILGGIFTAVIGAIAFVNLFCK